MRSQLLSLATAVPPHSLAPEALLDHLGRFWPQLSRLELADQIGTRHLVEDPALLMEPRGLSESMKLYRGHAISLAKEVSAAALDRAGLSPAQVDLVVSVSCTGYMVPSLDAHLANRMGMRGDVLRLPITELGCSAGAAGLAFAHRHLGAHPRDRVLVVAVELSSLSFRPSDRSRDNLIASMVFGDGAAAAVLAADGPGPGLRIQSAGSRLVPDSTAMLGFDLRDEGFHVVLSRRLPDLLTGELGRAITDFRNSAGVGRLDFVAAHGGGPRIIEAVEAVLGLPPQATQASREVFRRVGNVSSASILFTLAELAETLGPTPSEGIGIGLGPGVSVEMLHLRYCP
jgi:predicted naringenin-chalcone synthase